METLERTPLQEEQQEHWTKVKGLLENFNAEWNLANAVFADLYLTATSLLKDNKEKIYSRPLIPPQLRYVFAQVQQTQNRIEELLEIIIANGLLSCVRDESNYLKYTGAGHNVSMAIREGVYEESGLTETEWFSRRMFIEVCINNTVVPSYSFFSHFSEEEIENLHRGNNHKVIPYIKKWIQRWKNNLLKLLPGQQTVTLIVLWLACLTMIGKL